MSRAAPKKIRVGVFVETRLIRDSLMQMLKKEADFVCSKLSDFSTEWPNHHEVILLDSQDVTESNLRQLSTSFPNTRIVVLNGDHPQLNLLLCSRIGVIGFTLKTSTLAEIATTIRSAAVGVRVIPECIGVKLFEAVSEAERSDLVFGATADGLLTPREHDVACLAANGLINKQIAAKLSVEVETVKTHMRSILRKLGVRNRVELARLFETRKRERNAVA